MKKSYYLPILGAGIFIVLSATSITSLQASEMMTPIEGPEASSLSSSCAADKCKVTTQEPDSTTKKCPDGYTEYTYSFDGGNQKQMCAKCEGLDKCPTGETCTLEKYTQEVGGHTIKHMRCLCKTTSTSSDTSLSSSEFSSSSLSSL